MERAKLIFKREPGMQILGDEEEYLAPSTVSNPDYAL
jgi:hypothetical protein